MEPLGPLCYEGNGFGDRITAINAHLVPCPSDAADLLRRMIPETDRVSRKSLFCVFMRSFLYCSK